jgi:hypothetical protein
VLTQCDDQRMDVVFRLDLRDRLPSLLQQFAPDAGARAAADQMAAAARDQVVALSRRMQDVAIPRVGEDVIANPNFEPLGVLSVIHDLDGNVVTVDLGELDADEVGEGLALEVLLSGGWQAE